ncbi:hypothetical protein C6499_19230 [Candidatus Poribacteria bacterium]|nr:MAG: hypothetical protein C6499_19230 [Candidatus Poribacteria bacterium]
MRGHLWVFPPARLLHLSPSHRREKAQKRLRLTPVKLTTAEKQGEAMKFSINRNALLKALQSVRVTVASQESLASLFEVSVSATDAGTVVVTAGDSRNTKSTLRSSGVSTIIQRTIDAEVTQAGTVVLPIKRFSRILQSATAETADFTMRVSGQVEIQCGSQRFRLGESRGDARSDDDESESPFRVKMSKMR